MLPSFDWSGHHFDMQNFRTNKTDQNVFFIIPKTNTNYFVPIFHPKIQTWCARYLYMVSNSSQTSFFAHAICIENYRHVSGLILSDDH